MKTSLTQRLLSRDNALPMFLLRVLLAPLQVLYMAVVTTRNALYDTGLLSGEAAGAPVISVGNLTVGGTGKTPLVIELARRALAKGRKVAIVTRGYGAVADDAGRSDEAALIAERVPQATLIISPDKLTGARQAASEGADVILVDDGFQHRRLQRDLDIVVADARAPFGNGYQLPVGGMRESPSAMARADVVVLTHTEGLDKFKLHDSKASIQAQNRGVPMVLGTHRPLGVRSVTEQTLSPLSDLMGRDVFLFCGIGSPEGFQITVESLGAVVTGLMPFPDHHAFSGTDLAEVRSQARTARLLCTEKDAAKVARLAGNDDVLCLVIDMELVGELPALPGIDG
ncbi:MAG: tetraacyldisaccharide 4'-kinase [Planctomycetota bacterium]|nr:MAG: tetraacyldisaccharide 4'-kinase [Planctomycetota bacterium]